MVSDIPALLTRPPLPVMSVLPLYLLSADLLASRKAVGAKPAATRKKGFCAMGVHTENEEDHDDAATEAVGFICSGNGDIECHVGMNRQH